MRTFIQKYAVTTSFVLTFAISWGAAFLAVVPCALDLTSPQRRAPATSLPIDPATRKPGMSEKPRGGPRRIAHGRQPDGRDVRRRYACADGIDLALEVYAGGRRRVDNGISAFVHRGPAYSRHVAAIGTSRPNVAPRSSLRSSRSRLPPAFRITTNLSGMRYLWPPDPRVAAGRVTISEEDQ